MKGVYIITMNAVLQSFIRILSSVPSRDLGSHTVEVNNDEGMNAKAELFHDTDTGARSTAEHAVVVQGGPTDNGICDDMTQDLAIRIGSAISSWANKYHLEHLPRDIVLDQALAILTTVRDSQR